MLNLQKVCAKFSFTYPCPRKLREIMKLSLIEREDRSTIADIWQQYHNERSENISYAISKDEYKLLKARQIASPMFLCPVIKDKSEGSHFMLLGQAQEKSFIFTFLDDFKQQQNNAQPYFVLTLFDELLFKREIVLVRGDIINFKIDKKQAEWVMGQALTMYMKDDLYNNYVYTFNNNTQQFSFDAFKQHYKIQ